MAIYKIKGLMVERGLKQSDLAEKLNLSSRSFNLKVNGKREFKQSELVKLSSLLNVTYEQMLGGERNEK